MCFFIFSLSVRFFNRVLRLLKENRFVRRLLFLSFATVFYKTMNKKSKHTQLFRWIYTLLTIGVTVFIFTNSLQGGEASGLRSAMVTEWLNRLIGHLGIDYRFTVYAVRKLAHLTEFMLLGLFLTLTLRVYTNRLMPHISWPLFAGLFTAVSDETIQLFGRGRGPSLRDVWIDFAGFTIGLCIALFLIRSVRRSKRPTRKNRR